MSGRRSRAGRAISRRLQTPKPKGTAAELIRELQKRPEHKGLLACGYGVHDYDSAGPFLERCGRCGATKAIPMAMMLTRCEQVWVDDVRAGRVHEHIERRMTR